MAQKQSDAPKQRERQGTSTAMRKIAQTLSFSSLIVLLMALGIGSMVGTAWSASQLSRAAALRPMRLAQVPRTNSALRRNPVLGDIAGKKSSNNATRGLSRLSASDLGPGSQDFDVQVIPEELEAKIGSAPKTYFLEQILILRVAASNPGWRISLAASNLKPENQKPRDTIDKSEICFLPPGSEPLLLAQPQPIIADGRSGSSTVEIPLALVTTQPHALGSYEGHLSLVFKKPQGAESTTIKVPFRVTISGSAQMSLRNNRIYFHYGRPDEPQTAAITGQITADMPMRLTLRQTQDGRVDMIPLVSSISSIPLHMEKRFSSAPAPGIPVEWNLFAGSVQTTRESEFGLEGGKTSSWVLPSTPGKLEYRIDCTLKPDAYQRPGDYGMSLTVILEPVL